MMGRWLSAFVGLGMLTFGCITFVLGLILGHGMGGSFAIANPPAEASATGAEAVASAPAADGAAGGQSVSVSVSDSSSVASAGSTAPASGPAEASVPVETAAPTEVAALPPAEAADPPPAAAEPPAVVEVRSGPSPQRPPSSKMRGSLLEATTAMPPPETVAEVPPPVPVEAAGPPSILSVQVARFLMKENADALAAELAALGYKPQIVLAREPGIPAAPSWYMVTLGPQPDAETANRLAREAAAALGLPAHAVSWPLATQ
ncbi:SPOR domain-containing protein [Arenibaculum sp.]|jgi:DNA polymerase-3 subunit gamma/tau|uniref:SPOR domain-containing protein n=1 Tax=Arenibaculum sp. TaxID=2865862 RepID=UPI002E0D5D66|nr:SPOR domain-containing protein [Arenibaculum sp.]